MTRRNQRTSPRGFTGLPKMGQDMGPAAVLPTGIHPRPNPAESAALRSRKTDVRNGITAAHALSGEWSTQEQEVNRKRRDGRIARKANALEKVRGHADAGTMAWPVEAQARSREAVNTAPRSTWQPMYGWNTLPWKRFERQVFKLQKRIYQASLRGDSRAVHRLQRLMVNSWCAKCLAVRRVSQDNRGKNTAGVDGVASLTPERRLDLVQRLKLGDKPLPLRRVWIPKPGARRGEQRGLGIPTLRDRALQALMKLALEPEWEARFEPNSYGFRPGRSCHDAIQAIRAAIHTKPKYVLDADIAKCFDRINHEALLKKLDTSPTFRRTIKGWLRAGVMEGKELFPTAEGTPQGGVASPLLANIALHGLEEHLRTSFPKRRGPAEERWLPQVVRYADDFVVLHQDLGVIQEAKRLAEEWLAGMGLELKPNKTRISHTLHYQEGSVGFDFLGFQVRQYPVGKTHSARTTHGEPLGFTTMVKPTKAAQSRHLAAIKEIVDAHKAAPQAALITRLNPVNRGWANYYRAANSARTFSRVDHYVYLKLWRWAKRRHPQKSRRWIARKYWGIDQNRGWKFASAREGVWLQRHRDMHVQRHVKVRGQRSPYDGDWAYWATRLAKHPELPNRVAKLLWRQQGRCAWCGLHFRDGDHLELDHKVPLSQGGGDLPSNWQMLHGHCHHAKTSLETSNAGRIHDQDHAIEEPDAGKPTRPVLKTNHRGRPDG